MDDFIADFMVQIVEEAEIAAFDAPRQQRPARLNENTLTETVFKKNFRLSKDLFENLTQMLEPVIQPITTYDVRTKLLCALHFFGHGSYQTPVGNHININISQPSVSRCIDEVVQGLNHPSIFGEWVHFPNTFEELDHIVRQFYMEYRFPGIIGAVDCTHVAIVPPSTNLFDERSYVNRKRYHSINTQLICDAKLKILNCNALFPGSTHDSYIWNNSNVVNVLEHLHQNGHNNYHVIGDSGYALRPWCLTPIMDAEANSSEERYNACFKKARSNVERCNGVLKARFRCLLKDRVLHYTNKATKIINACTVLHNMCIGSNLEDPNDEYLDDEQLGILPSPVVESIHGSRVNVLLLQGRAKQRQIVENYFG